MRFRPLVLIPIIIVLITLSPLSGASLTLYPGRAGPLDLAISGDLENLAPGQTAYLRVKDLRALPTTTLSADNKYFPGPKTLTILPLKTLWASLPHRPEADTLLASCADGYASVYDKTFIDKYNPFLVLEINGKPLDKIIDQGTVFNGGPYIIDVSESISPGVSTYLDIGHKEPWGVNAIAAATHRIYFSTLYSSKQNPSGDDPLIDQGRIIWINSCNSCHQGPDKSIGGTKSGIPFGVLQAQALYNQAYFRQYIRNPQKMAPGSRMEPHPHYTDAQLDALTSFLRSVKL